MITFTEAQKRLEAELSNPDVEITTEGHSYVAVDAKDVATVLDALNSAQEGLYRVYVELGEDTDGARNARELFGPMINTAPGVLVPQLVRQYRTEMEAELDAVERERDEALAVIERAQEYVVRHHFDTTTGRAVDAMLSAAPVAALRAVKAEAWDEGWRRGFTDGFTDAPAPSKNPYFA